MKKIISQLTIIAFGIILGYAGVALAAPLEVNGWGFSFMPTSTTGNNQDYNPGRPDRNVGQGGGWISLSQSTGGGSIPYGVIVDDASGNFSEHAWNPNLGYINFSGANVNPACFSDQSGSYPVTGTITFLSASLPQAGGWNGVVQMQGNWNDTVQVDCATGQLSGYGWGDYVVGWIDFKWVKIMNNPDVCPDDNDYSETLGMQTTVPNGFQKVNGQCVPDETTCPANTYRYDGVCYERRCIAQDGSNDFIYFNNDDPEPEICKNKPPEPPCTDPAVCPTGPTPIYKEN